MSELGRRDMARRVTYLVPMLGLCFARRHAVTPSRRIRIPLGYRPGISAAIARKGYGDTPERTRLAMVRHVRKRGAAAGLASHLVGDQIAAPLDRISVSKPTTFVTLTEEATAIGGLLGAVIGVLGKLGSLSKAGAVSHRLS